MEASIEIGFSNNIYDNPGDIVGSVQLIADHFHAIEIELAEEAQPAIFGATPEEYAQIVQGLKSLSAERSLAYSVHAAWYGPSTDLTSDKDEERLASVCLLARSIQFAADIGSNMVTCHPGHRHGQDEQQLIDKLADSLIRVREMAPVAAITLCVENMGAQRPSHTVLDADQFAEVCDRAKVSVCLDIVHLASVFPETQRLIEATTAFAPLVRHIHLGDMIRPSHRHLPIGKGDLPLDAVLQQIAASGYHGHAIVEELTRGCSPEDYVAGALAFRDRARAAGFVR